MASSYGYVKREVQDMQINWAEVGQNFRNVLDEESRVRQDKKDAIDKDTREYEKRVTDSNLLGRDTKFNEGVLIMGADAQHMSRMNTMLLKSGQLKPRDYTIKTQNMIDGTNNVFKVIESYNNLQADVMDGVNSKELSEDMLSNWAMVQDMANFNDNRIMFNPYTGEVNVARMVEDPANPTGPRIPSNDASKLQSVQSLLNITNDNVLRYKMIEHINDNISTLEPIVMQKINEMGGTYKKGTLIKYTSFFSKRTGGFDDLSKEEKEQLAANLDMDVSSAGMLGSMHKTISDYADSQVEFDRNGMSILIDFKKVSDDGVPYSTTFDESETKDANGNRDENVILKKQENGRIIYELTDTQKKEAKNVFINQLTSRLAESTETTTVDMFKEQSPPPKKTIEEIKLIKTEENSLEAQKLWNQMWSATPQEKQNIMTAFLASAIKLDDGLVAIVPTADGLGLDVEYLDKAKNTRISFNAAISKEEWAKLGTELTGLFDPDKQLNAGGFGDSSSIGVDASGKSNWGDSKSFRAGSTVFNTKFKDAVTTKLGELVLKKEAKDVIAKFKTIFPEGNNLGIRYVNTSWMGIDDLSVTVDGFNGDDSHKGEYELDADVDWDNNAKQKLKEFIDWLTYATQKAGKANALNDFIGSGSVKLNGQ